MSKPDPNLPRDRQRTLAHAVRPILLLATLLLLPVAVQAGWLTKVVDAAGTAAPRAAKPATSAIDNAALHVRSLPALPDNTAVLAAQATQEGHWRFVNKAGETYTAGTPEELKRAASVLLPEAKADVKLSLYLTGDTIFLYRAALADLPKGSELYVVAGSESYRVLQRAGAAGEQLLAEIRPNILVDLADRARFEEAVWQLSRPLEAASVRVVALEPGGPPRAASVRVVALEPGGPPRLASTPHIDPATRRALVDTIDPPSLPAALGAVRGQTVLLTGRIEGRLLYVQPASGPERSVLLPDLFKAAEDTDVNLIVLHSASTPRQPGGRNWLWQRVQVKGLEQAMQRTRFADFLSVLAGSGSRLLVSATPSSRRTALAADAAVGLPAGAPVGGLFSGLIGDVTGRVTIAGLQADMLSAERQQELDRRLVAGIPSDIQTGYLLLAFLGLLGLPVSRAWWQRLWPRESAAEYALRSGYWAARVVRGGAFLLLFLPLTAPATAPLNLWRQLCDALSAPVRLWRRLSRRQASAGAGAG